MSQLDNWPPDDLRLYKQESDDGETIYWVYSFQLDALTLASGPQLEQLRARGVQEIDELPA